MCPFYLQTELLFILHCRYIPPIVTTIDECCEDGGMARYLSETIPWDSCPIMGQGTDRTTFSTWNNACVFPCADEVYYLKYLKASPVKSVEQSGDVIRAKIVVR
jgi:hypothetical protein